MITKNELQKCLKSLKSSPAVKQVHSNQAHLLKQLVNESLAFLKHAPMPSELSKLELTIPWLANIFRFNIRNELHPYAFINKKNINQKKLDDAKAELFRINNHINDSLTDKFVRICEIALENIQDYLSDVEILRSQHNKLSAWLMDYSTSRISQDKVTNFLYKAFDQFYIKISNQPRRKALLTIFSWMQDVLDAKLETDEATQNILSREQLTKSIWDSMRFRALLDGGLLMLAWIGFGLTLCLPFIHISFGMLMALVHLTSVLTSLLFFMPLILEHLRPFKSVAQELDFFSNLAKKQEQADDESAPLIAPFASKAQIFSP